MVWDLKLTLLLHFLADWAGLAGLVGVDLSLWVRAVHEAPTALLLSEDAGVEWISAEGGVCRVRAATPALEGESCGWIKELRRVKNNEFLEYAALFQFLNNNNSFVIYFFISPYLITE